MLAIKVKVTLTVVSVADVSGQAATLVATLGVIATSVGMAAADIRSAFIDICNNKHTELHVRFISCNADSLAVVLEAFARENTVQ